MDNTLRKEYEMSIINPKEIQTLDNFLKFIENKFQLLEIMKTKYDNFKKGAKPSTSINYNSKCHLCGQQHYTNLCKKLTEVEISKRYEIIKSAKLCFKCLNNNHMTVDCRSKVRCKKCNKAHNTMLHRDVAPTKSNVVTQESKDIMANSTIEKNEQTEVLLATAMIKVINGDKCDTLRALIDQGSQTSFIRKDAADKLGLQQEPNKTKISGIGDNKTHSIFF